MALFGYCSSGMAAPVVGKGGEQRRWARMVALGYEHRCLGLLEARKGTGWRARTLRCFGHRACWEGGSVGLLCLGGALCVQRCVLACCVRLLCAGRCQVRLLLCGRGWAAAMVVLLPLLVVCSDGFR